MALALLAALLVTGCSGGTSRAATPAASIGCGLVSCRSGHPGQPCSIAGYPGRVVQVSARKLGCDLEPGKFASPAAASPEPTVTGACVMGYELPSGSGDSLDAGQYAGFIPGPPRGETVGGYHYAPALAYQATITNGSASTAFVSGFAVVFYDASGAEAGSDQVVTSEYITPSQSLTWTELADTALDGSGDGGSDGRIPAEAATCQFIGWSS